jgi:inositol-phosphate phosphatase / L-galactose 1-phosphate phosphatase
MSDPAVSTPEALAECLAAAIGAAQRAGQVIAAAWNEMKKVEHKGAVDLVTETDKKCEALIKETLLSTFPDHAFIGEEEAAALGHTPQLTKAPTWLVDPVDGTTNFVHRFPFSCVSIGLAVDRRIAVGVVYNPILGELFHAVRGGGAFLNGDLIHCSDTVELGHALFATELGTRRDDAFLDACFGRIKALTKASRSVRACGSCALNLCSVAMGRLDAYFEIGLGGPWDVAAAALILEEAGGKVLDPAGGPFDVMSRRILGTNGHLAEAVAQVLADGPWAPDEPPATQG